MNFHNSERYSKELQVFLTLGIWFGFTAMGFSDELPARDAIFSASPGIGEATDTSAQNLPKTIKLKTDPVTFQSQDNVTLGGFTVQPALQEPPWPAVVLVPMEGKPATSYTELVRELAVRGWYVLSFDLRGSGGSTRQGIRRLDIRNFRAGDDYQRMVFDVEAAIRFLADRPNVIQSQVAIVGAELGANLSVQTLRKWMNTGSPAGTGSQNRIRFIGAVLLSPGQLYKGVGCDVSDIATLNQLPLFLCASLEDSFSYQTVRSYEAGKNLNPNMEMYILEQAGTGTNMFTANRFLCPQITDWLETQRKKDAAAK